MPDPAGVNVGRSLTSEQRAAFSVIDFILHCAPLLTGVPPPVSWLPFSLAESLLGLLLCLIIHLKMNPFLPISYILPWR